MDSADLIPIAINTSIIGKRDLTIDKAAAKALTENYQIKNLALESFADEIRAGHNWTNIFLTPDEEFHRKKGHFRQATLLGVDVDNDDEIDAPTTNGKKKKIKVRRQGDDYLSFEQALNHPFIRNHAALIYTSPSHKEEHHKFRPVFWFPEPITSVELFERIADAFIWLFKSDDSCSDCTRFFYGTASDGQVIVLGNRLTWEVINEVVSQYEAVKELKANTRSGKLDISVDDVPDDADISSRREIYAERAIRRAIDLINNSVPPSFGAGGEKVSGNRHKARTKAAYLLGGYVGGGLLSYEKARSVLEAAVENNTNNYAAAMRTIDDCLKAGMSHPITFEMLESERLVFVREKAGQNFDPRVKEIISAEESKRDGLIRNIARDVAMDGDALLAEKIGKTLKTAKVLLLSTWQLLLKEERERNQAQQRQKESLLKEDEREASLQLLLKKNSDLESIHHALSETTSSPHSHDIVELALAVSVSHLLSSEVLLWLLIVGAPSSDKTQTALSIRDAPHIFHLDTLTENAFISGFILPDGSAPRDLLSELDGRCMTIKDLNALFGQHPDKVAKVLGDLTAIYDGEFAKWSGTRGNVKYEARFSLIGCITPFSLSQHHRYMSIVGARFLSYRVEELGAVEVEKGFDTIWEGSGNKKDVLRSIASAYAAQLHQKLDRGELARPVFSEEAKKRLNALARFIAIGRAVVHTQREEITTKSGRPASVYGIAGIQREEPFRALLQLRVLALSLALVHQRSEITEHELEICRRVVLSSMPYDRSMVLALFRDPAHITQNYGLTRKAAAEGIHKARNQAIRLLTELEAIGMLRGEKIYDDRERTEVWTYFPASDEFTDIMTKPVKPLDHIADIKNLCQQDVVLCKPPLTQNHDRAEENSIRPEVTQGDEKQEQATDSTANPPASVASVPFMITRMMHKQLADLGYKSEQIDKMTPEEAWRIINGLIPAKAAENVSQSVKCDVCEARVQLTNGKGYCDACGILLRHA